MGAIGSEQELFFVQSFYAARAPNEDQYDEQFKIR